MAILKNNSQLAFSFMGTGDTYRIAQYDGINHEHTLVASIPTTNNVAATGFLNSLVAPNAFVAGDNKGFYIVATSVPEATTVADLLANHADKFAVLGDINNDIKVVNGVDFLGLPNPDGSFILTTYDRMYQISAADGKPCVHIGQNAVQSQLAEWAQIQPPVPVSAWLFDQATVSLRPELYYDETIDRNYLSQGTINYVEPAVITTPDYYTFSIAADLSQSSASLTIYCGAGFTQQAITLNRSYFSAFTSSTTGYAQQSGYHVYTIVVPRNSSFNGGRARLLIDGVFTVQGSNIITRESLVVGIFRQILIPHGHKVTAICMQNTDMGAFMGNLTTSMGATCAKVL